MYKKIDALVDIIIKTTFESLKLFLIFIILYKGYSSGNSTMELGIEKDIMMGTIIVIALGSFTSNKLRSSLRFRPILEKIAPVLGIVVPILVSGYIYGGKMSLLIVLFFYYAYAWMKGFKYQTDFEGYTYVVNTFWISILAMIFLLFTIGISSFTWFKVNMSGTVIVYFITSLVYFSRLNFTKAYGKNKNTINKSKNSIVINFVSSIMAVLIGGLVVLDMYIPTVKEKATESVIWLLTIVFYPLLLVMNKLFGKIAQKYWEFQTENVKMEIPDNKMKEYAKEEFTRGETAKYIMEYGKWVLLALVLVFIVYKLFKTAKNMKVEENIDDEIEVKDFVFSKEDLKNRLKNKLGGIKNRFGVKKGLDLSNLPAIRRIYSEIIMSLAESGLKFNENETTKEFSQRVQNSNFDKVTLAYNKFRYGEKELTEEDLKEAQKMNEKYKNINK